MLPLARMSIGREDERAFMNTLYQTHKAIMYRQALSILHEKDSVEDVVGDACVALIGKISLIRSMNCYTLRAYIVSTVRNTAINFIARRDRQGKYAFLDAGDAVEKVSSATPEVLDTLIRREEIDRLKDAISVLPEHERLALTMKYLDELPDRDIASVLGIQPASVRSCLMRARRHVYEQMKE